MHDYPYSLEQPILNIYTLAIAFHFSNSPKEDDPILMEDLEVLEVARKRGKSVAQILIRYHIEQNIACLPKSVTPSRIKENFQVMPNFIRASANFMYALYSYMSIL